MLGLFRPTFVALKVRELLQPAAKERQGERTDLKPKAKNISPDLGESFAKGQRLAQICAKLSSKNPVTSTLVSVLLLR